MTSPRWLLRVAAARRSAALILLLVALSACSRKPQQETLPAQRPEPAESESEVSDRDGDAPSIGPAITGVRLGDAAPMPGLKMLAVDGARVSLNDVRGKAGLLVIFTCNACPYARAWEQRIVALGNEYRARGVGVIAVNANDPGVVPEDGFDAMKARAAERGMKYPYAVDATSSLARAFGATRTPEAFLFSAGGALVYHGTIDDNAQEPTRVTQHYLRDALAAVVSGQSVPVPETKSLGCSIKFRS